MRMWGWILDRATEQSQRRRALAGLCVLAALAVCGPAQALTIQTEQDAWALANALVPAGGGLVVTHTNLVSHALTVQPPTGPSRLAVSSGVFANSSGTYGIGSGIVLSTGDVADYGDGPNSEASRTTRYLTAATATQAALAAEVTGRTDLTYHDATQLDLIFQVEPGFDRIELQLVFGSEEWPEFVHSSFIDGFAIFLDAQNVALVDGLPINVDHPGMAPLPGTELDALLAPGGDPLLRLSVPLSSSGASHVLTLLVFDTSDFRLDTTVYLSNVRAGSAIPEVPEPGPALMLLAGLAVLAARRSR